MEGSGRLGKNSIAKIDQAASRSQLLVPAISVWEIALLVEKGRLALSQDLDQWVERVFALPGVGLAPLEPAIALEGARLPGGFHGDPADRLIAATARHHDAELMTVDRAILAYASTGHLKAIDAAQ